MVERFEPSPLCIGMRALRSGLASGAVAAMLAGCSAVGIETPDIDLFPSTPEPEEIVGLTPEERLLAQAPPRFEVGDSYHYDNPKVTWRVTEVRGDEVDWVADSGETQTTTHNPLMPAIAWKSESRGSGRRLISDISGSLFPLKVANKMTFKSTVSTDTPPYAWEFDWVCEVTAEAVVDAAAGNFNTFEVKCGRDRPDEVTFFYSPRAAHYVRLDSVNTKGGGIIRRDLQSFERVAYLPDGTRIISSGGEAYVPGFRQPAGAETPEPPPAQPVAGVQELPASVASAMADLNKDGSAKTPAGPQAPVALSAGSTAPQSASAAAVPAPATGTAAVHLASYKDPKNADRGWAQLTKSYADLLGPLSPVVKRVDLGSKGIYHRLHAGPLPDSAQAEALCKALKQRGVYCKPAKL